MFSRHNGTTMEEKKSSMYYQIGTNIFQFVSIFLDMQWYARSLYLILVHLLSIEVGCKGIEMYVSLTLSFLQRMEQIKGVYHKNGTNVSGFVIVCPDL